MEITIHTRSSVESRVDPIKLMWLSGSLTFTSLEVLICLKKVIFFNISQKLIDWQRLEWKVNSFLLTISLQIVIWY